MEKLRYVKSMIQYWTGAPGESGFGSGATGFEVATKYRDQCEGKVAMVTGATSGYGFEIARALASTGIKLYITAKTSEQGAQTIKKIHQSFPSADIKCIVLDLASLESVRRAAERFQQEDVPLHILVLNAGVMSTPEYMVTAENFEYQFGVNSLGHFYLLNLLLNRLLQAAPSRVVFLSSVVHWVFGDSDIIDFDMEHLKRQKPSVRYANSKLANLLYAKEFNRRFESRGVTAYACHPGATFTNIYRNHFGYNVAPVLEIPSLLIGAKTAKQGASTPLYCALSPDAKAGEYYADCNVDHVFIHPKANDREMAKHLYEWSEHLLGIHMS